MIDEIFYILFYILFPILCLQTPVCILYIETSHISAAQWPCVANGYCVGQCSSKAWAVVGKVRKKEDHLCPHQVLTWLVSSLSSSLCWSDSLPERPPLTENCAFPPSFCTFLSCLVLPYETDNGLICLLSVSFTRMQGCESWDTALFIALFQKSAWHAGGAWCDPIIMHGVGGTEHSQGFLGVVQIHRAELGCLGQEQMWSTFYDRFLLVKLGLRLF